MNANPYERILVPTDLTDFDDLAIRYALLFHERLGSKITMLHAEEVSWLGAEHPIGYYFDNPNEAKEELRARLVEFAHRTTPESARVATIFADDAPERAIVKAAGDIHADLIIMATHGRHGLRRAVLGSVTESVLRHTTRPVLTVTPRLFAAGGPPALRTILCPVGSNDIAREALQQATMLAEAFDSNLVTMNVGEDDAGAVLDRADHVHADLIVVGAQHRFFRDMTVAGSTTERITRFARHAVLTVVHQPVMEAVEDQLMTV